jgi:hypothetical protein
VNSVLVVGICGSGKTTLAAGLAARLGLPHIETDALRHGPGWTVQPAFVAEVDRATATPGWVVDSAAYTEVAGMLWGRADTVVWLDLRRSVVLLRVARRTASRVLRRELLWSGNRESLWGALSRGHPLAKVIMDFRSRRAQTAGELAGFSGRAVRLRSPAEADHWLATMIQPIDECRAEASTQ